MKKQIIAASVVIGLLVGAWYMTPAPTTSNNEQVIEQIQTENEQEQESESTDLNNTLQQSSPVKEDELTNEDNDNNKEEISQDEINQDKISQDEVNQGEVNQDQSSHADNNTEVLEDKEEVNQEENQGMPEIPKETEEEIEIKEETKEEAKKEVEEVKEEIEEVKEEIEEVFLEEESKHEEDLVALEDETNTEQAQVDSNDGFYVTLSVSVQTLLANKDLLDKPKQSLVPVDGWIYKPTQVVAYAGETVFDVLLREMQANKIHMEYVNTPLYESSYIEGIANLYEFDAGDLSGWMYSVNSWFPNYGASKYTLEPEDVIEWVYTCDLGEDVGRKQ